MKINQQFIKSINRLADIRGTHLLVILRKLDMSEQTYNAISRADYKVPDVFVNKLVEEFHVNPEFLYFPDKDVPIISTYHSPALKDLQRNLQGKEA